MGHQFLSPIHTNHSPMKEIDARTYHVATSFITHKETWKFVFLVSFLLPFPFLNYKNKTVQVVNKSQLILLIIIRYFKIKLLTHRKSSRHVQSSLLHL